MPQTFQTSILLRKALSLPLNGLSYTLLLLLSLSHALTNPSDITSSFLALREGRYAHIHSKYSSNGLSFRLG